MSANPPQPPAAISPLAIATAFIKQYYLVLSTNNSFIHKFYKGDSQISFSPSFNTPAISQSFSSLENREEKFTWAANSRVDFANGSIDAQESVDGGILVVVTGEIFLEGKSDKKQFVQTFFLKDDGKRAPRRNYFVFNDVFRFLERDNKVEAPTVQEEIEDKVEEAPGTEDGKVETQQEETKSMETSETAEMNGNAATSEEVEEVKLEPEQTVEESVVVTEQEKVSEPEESDATEVANIVSETEPAPESPEEEAETPSQVEDSDEKPSQESASNAKSQPAKSTQQPKPPGSWASLVAGSSSKTSPSSPVEAPASTTVSKPSPKKEKEKESATTTPAATTNSTTSERPKRPPRPQETEAESNPATAAPASRASGYGSKGSSSLYIKNVGEGISESDLRDLFSEYPFKIVNVSFYPSRGYAFVDFADANAVNSIMKENRQTFHINGRVIEVEKKSSDRRRTGGNSGGTGSGSRGGNGNGGGSGSGNPRSSPKGQRQRSHSGRRLNGGSDGDRRGRKGRSGGGGDKKKEAASSTGGAASS